MELLFGGAVIAIFATTMLIAGTVLAKEENTFRQNKRVGKAVIVGYDQEDQSNHHSLLVKIPALNDGKLYSCPIRKTGSSDFSVGKEIDIFYANKKEFGVSLVEVRLANAQVPNYHKISYIFKTISWIAYAISIGMTVFGVFGFLL